jgi:LAO/AO transport system kinase
MNMQESVLQGDRLALSRLLTEIESDSEKGRLSLNDLFKHTGNAHLIGVTGAPGTGKSSLVNRLVQHYREPVAGERAKRIAVLAVDPSSPFSGGAVLGDRIRMSDLFGDEDVFIRSMASRGSLGGLAAASARMVQAFDAAKYDIIIIETVGAGQAEVDIAKLAHTTLVVEAPGLGDDVQAIKAGILEIADILVLNKADRPGVEAAERALKTMLQLGHPIEKTFRHHGQIEKVSEPEESETDEAMWITPLHRVVATDGTGLDDLVAAIAAHKEFLQSSGDWEKRDRARLESELEALLQSELMTRWRDSNPRESYQKTLDQLYSRELSPQQAANALLNRRGMK